MNKVSILWFRRDLRLDDNTALTNALNSETPVLPLFIFDDSILENLPTNDARVNFIYDCLGEINIKLKSYQSGILIKKGKPIEIWKQLISEYEIESVFVNKDYEPYALKRDSAVVELLKSHGIPSYWFKDQVIFEENEILKKDGTPYTVYTPYKKQWLEKFKTISFDSNQKLNSNFYSYQTNFPTKNELGIGPSNIQVKPFRLDGLEDYSAVHDFPDLDGTSYLSPHLRFGTISVRKMVEFAQKTSDVFLRELVWREFFMQILFQFPKVVTSCFKEKYNEIKWRNNEEEFQAWCSGKTGYPMVDAGMRQLNKTGYMHNRVRMVTASFLCKHLLIDWRWGEAYFAKKLLDFDLASNNGNWQWAAGTGCDAAPYFRIFNPTEQLKKFDKNLIYTKKWVKDLNELTYPQPIVNHKFARERALKTYKKVV